MDGWFWFDFYRQDALFCVLFMMKPSLARFHLTIEMTYIPDEYAQENDNCSNVAAC